MAPQTWSQLADKDPKNQQAPPTSTPPAGQITGVGVGCGKSQSQELPPSTHWPPQIVHADPSAQAPGEHAPAMHVSGLVQAFPSQLAFPSGLNRQSSSQQDLVDPLSAPSSQSSPTSTISSPQVAVCPRPATGMSTASAEPARSVTRNRLRMTSPGSSRTSSRLRFRARLCQLLYSLRVPIADTRGQLSAVSFQPGKGPGFAPRCRACSAHAGHALWQRMGENSGGGSQETGNDPFGRQAIQRSECLPQLAQWGWLPTKYVMWPIGWPHSVHTTFVSTSERVRRISALPICNPTVP